MAQEKPKSLRSTLEAFFAELEKEIPQNFQAQDWKAQKRMDSILKFIAENTAALRKSRDEVYDNYAHMHGENFSPEVTRLRKKNSGRPAAEKELKYADLDF